MKRRPLCLSAAAAMLGWSIAVRAQGKRSARIGVLTTASRQDPNVQALFAKLGELGWSEWRNLKVEYHALEIDSSDSVAMVAKLVRANCELIVTLNTPAALAAKAGAPSIPLVFLMAGDPVALGFAASLAQPGGIATGLAWAPHEWGPKLLTLLKEVAPRATRVGVIYGAGYQAVSQPVYAALSTQAAAGGIALRAFAVSTRKDVHALDAVWTREPIDGLVVNFDPVTIASMGDIVRLTALQRVPAVYASRYFVDAGGLMSYGIHWPAAVARSAEIVARVLDGTKPADIPIEQAPQFELLVNLRTARALRITVPPSVMSQATEVLE